MMSTEHSSPAAHGANPDFRLSRLGLWTLARREVHRFLVVWIQALLGPVISAWLLLAIFAVVFQRAGLSIAGVAYVEFLAPGLTLMSAMQNAFSNTTSSILIAKVDGSIATVLAAPLSPAEAVLGYALGGTARGIAVGLLLAIGFVPVASPAPAMLPALLALLAGASLLFALLGVIGGIFAARMEHVAFLNGVLVMPLTMLSGVFYAAESLPARLRPLLEANPIYHLVDGFRTLALGRNGADLTPSALVLGGGIVLAFVAGRRLFAVSGRLRP